MIQILTTYVMLLIIIKTEDNFNLTITDNLIANAMFALP